MYIGTEQRLHGCNINEVSCQGEVAEHVCKFKYLGVILDSNLKFTEHIDFVKRKTFAKMKTLARTSQYISQKMSLQLYKSLVISHVDYRDAIYDSVSSADAKKLQVIQNLCISMFVLII